jgi:hypothetical protein
LQCWQTPGQVVHAAAATATAAPACCFAVVLCLSSFAVLVYNVSVVMGLSYAADADAAALRAAAVQWCCS